MPVCPKIGCGTEMDLLTPPYNMPYEDTATVYQCPVCGAGEVSE